MEAASLPPTAPPEPWDDVDWPYDWIPRFLHALALMPNVTSAARMAGITRVRAYQVRNENALFRQAWVEAIEQAIDVIETYAHRMGTNGIEQHTIRRTVKRERNAEGALVVVEEREVAEDGVLVSPQMTMFMLRHYRPAVYAENVKNIQLSGPEGGPVQIEVGDKERESIVGSFTADVLRLIEQRGARELPAGAGSEDGGDPGAD